MVARLDARDAAPHLFDDPCAFMPEHKRLGGPQFAAQIVQVRVTDPCRAHAHEQLVRLGWVEFDGFDGELIELRNDGG
jgi:hypothetical protein